MISRDEHDRTRAGIVRDGRSIIFDAALRPDELLERTGDQGARRPTSTRRVAGFVTDELDRIPEVGDEVELLDGVPAGRAGGREPGRPAPLHAGRDTSPASPSTTRSSSTCGRISMSEYRARSALAGRAAGGQRVLRRRRVRRDLRPAVADRAARGGRADGRDAPSLYAMEHATLMLATSQLGITICSLLILNVSEPAIHHLLEIPLGLTSLSVDAVAAIAFVVALVLVTFLHVVFGEMVPKNISFSVPDRAVLLLAPPLVMFSRVFQPVIFALNATANGVLRLFRRRAEGRGDQHVHPRRGGRRSSSSRPARASSPTPAERSATRSSSPPRRCRTSRCRWRRW